MRRLYVVPTPIGNLEDITLRALRVLAEVPLILAEDTRHTRKLLTHYSIETPMWSYHQHNKLAQIEAVLTRLETTDVALVSSAGMPAVSDPGFELIHAVVAAGMEVDVLPGASAVITAVVAAAIPSAGFLFLGFLPRTSSERRRRLREVADVSLSVVLYEAPHRLKRALNDVLAVLGDRDMVAAREMTKLHQELVRGKVSDVCSRFGTIEPRGEFTLVIAPPEHAAIDRTDEVNRLLLERRSAGDNARDAVSRVSRELGVARNLAYKLWVDLDAR